MSMRKVSELEGAVLGVVSLHDRLTPYQIRKVFEPEDFAPAFSEEEIQQEKQIRAQLADQAAKK